MNSFSFLFFIFFILVYVIDCEFFLFFIKEEISSGCGLLRRFTPRNDSTHKLVIAKDSGEEWITVSSVKSYNEGLRITRLPRLF